MPARLLYLDDVGIRLALGALVRDSREAIGWSQRELAARARTSQAAIWRIETAQPGPLDLAVVERVLAALGIRCSLGIDDRHLADRRRQRDGVHAVLNGYVARRLSRLDGWLPPATEVPIGTDAPRGWIDLLAYRPADRSLVVDETKTDIPEMGALQRSVASYEREAPRVAAALGWRPVRTVGLVLGLDSQALGRRLADPGAPRRAAGPSPSPTPRQGAIDGCARRRSDRGVGRPRRTTTRTRRGGSSAADPGDPFVTPPGVRSGILELTSGSKPTESRARPAREGAI